MRRHGNPEWIRTNRRTIVSFPDGAPDRDLLRDQVFMFWEDVKHGIMPIGGRSRTRGEFAVRLDPPNHDWESFLLTTICTWRSYDRDDLTALTCDLFEEVASSLVLYGRALYEIVWGPEHERLRPQRWFALVPFPNHHLRESGHTLIQEGPRWTEPMTEETHRAELDRNEVLEIRLPSLLGSLGTQRQFLKTLNELNVHSVMWPYQDMAEGKQPTSFSFDEYRRNTFARVARLTRSWGWNARSLWDKDASEYFQMYRILRFRRAMAFLRDTVMQQLNQRLQSLGMPGSLVIKGLPSVNEIDGLIRRLEEGSIDFGGALDGSDINQRAGDGSATVK